jgi:PAS domain S-box-containing protein
LGFLNQLLSSDFMPHGYCYLWNPGILWLHVVSDILISFSYYCIPLILIHFARKNRDIAIARVFWVFGAFIMACGTSHLMEVWNVWHASYRLSGVIKAVTAGASLLTLSTITPLISDSDLIRERIHLLETNRKLEQRVAGYESEQTRLEAPLRRKVMRGLAAALVLIGFLCFLSLRARRLSARDADQVSHTQEVMRALESTMNDVLDIENGAWGFVATGAEPFLERAKSGKNRLQPDLDQLQLYAIDNPGRQQDLNELKIRTSAGLEAADRMVNTRRRTGAVPSTDEFMDGETRVAAVRASVRNMLADEIRLLEQHAASTKAARRQAGLLITVSTLAGAGLLTGAGIAVKREIGVSARARAQITLLNAELEQRVAKRTAELRDSENRLAGIIGSAMDAIITVNEEQCIVLFNQAAERIFDYPAAQAMGQRIDRFIPQRFRETHREHIRKFAESGAGTRSGCPLAERMALRSENKEFPIEASISQAEAGGRKLFTVIIRDMTERRRAEASLARLASIVESSDSTILSKDLNGNVTSWNKGAETLYGYREDEVIGRHINLVIPPELQAQESDALRKVGEGTLVRRAEITRRRKNGTLFSVSQIISPMRDASGKIIGVSTIAHDITERLLAEREIQKLRKELEQRVLQRTAELQIANHELEAFSYSVSHDLRAPLRHIAGFAGILLEEFADRLEPQAQHYLQRISDGTQKMGLLVDELLSLARLGRETPTLQLAGLDSIVADVINLLKAEYEGRSVEWKIGRLPFVECDPALMKQVFQNLISNALKYSRPRPRTVIEIAQIETDDGNNAIFVRDNGVGFSMKYADKLFGVFQRLHRSEDFEGTGVGLALVQRIIHKHGGRVWAEAELDRGATFYFTLPGAARSTEPQPASSSLEARA